MDGTDTLHLCSSSIALSPALLSKNFSSYAFEPKLPLKILCHEILQPRQPDSGLEPLVFQVLWEIMR